MEEKVQHSDERQSLSDPRRLSIGQRQILELRLYASTPLTLTTHCHHRRSHRRHAAIPTSLPAPIFSADGSTPVIHLVSSKGGKISFSPTGTRHMQDEEKASGWNISGIKGSPATDLVYPHNQARAAFTALGWASKQHSIVRGRYTV